MRTPLHSRRTARVVVALAGMTVAIAAACTTDVGDGVKPNQVRAPSATPVATREPYFEYQVEKQAQMIPGARLFKYPDVLRAAKVSGEVLAQFVVGADGRVEPGSFKALKSSHPLFTQAVTDALPNMHFEPADVGGRKVRQLVQQPFTFSLTKD